MSDAGLELWTLFICKTIEELYWLRIVLKELCAP